jgi:hemolysin D
MRNLRWLTHPLETIRIRYADRLQQLERDLEEKTVSLPAIAPWTKRLTQFIMVGVVAGAGWAIVARVDVVVNASGELEPMSQAQVIQSRVGGIVTAVMVQEGEFVKQGQVLMQLDKTALYNQLEALMAQREQLVEETAVLRLARQGVPPEAAPAPVWVSPEVLNRVQNRFLLLAQITGDPGVLSPEQQRRFALFEQQLRDRQSINELESADLQAQIAASENQLSQTNYQLGVEQELLTKLRPLLEEGAISRTDYLRRAIDVNALESQFTQRQLQRRQLEVNQLQAQVAGRNLVVEAQQESMRQLASLDSELDATIKDNQRQLMQVTAQLNQLQNDLKNQELRAPVDGVVFNLGPKLPGIVTQSGQTLLQVVPNESLIVRTQVANTDIANIRVGMPAEVRLDAYPFTEFGSVKGVVAKVGSETVTDGNPSAPKTGFPVEIQLDQQVLEQRSQRFTLKPGMTAVALIKIRQRAPITYITEELVRAIDAMRSVR